MNIKKLSSLTFMLACIGNYAVSAYVPTAGPLQLTDTPGRLGVISATLMNNPELQEQRLAFQRFANQFPGTHTYQGMIAAISNAQSPTGYQALEAFEQVIMHIYHEKAFITYMDYDPYYPVQGLRYTWFNPLTYINPQSWISDNNAELDQLLNEFDQLADIAMSKNPLLGARMKSTVHAYRHWRKYILGFMLTYFAQDRYKRNWKDTTLHALFLDKNYAKVWKNVKEDTSAAYSGLKTAAITMKNYFMPPAPPAPTKKWFNFFSR